ncbi:undecaprenyl-diphosphate phosphatase [Anaerolentibacter hominis]|uniref:undecaprenyl-diphosphate phosphatase n=1 Tax=Anaerolentibacter hominis TaxID=3079009 RepID=UPI0031B81FDB
MTLFKAIILGLVQGIAEFLPISSSGHLAIFRNILNFQTDTGLLFDVMLHFGTLVAIFVAFHRDIGRMIVEGLGIIADFFYNIGVFFANTVGKSGKRYRKVLFTSYRRFVMLILVSTIPTGILGLLLKDIVTVTSTTLLVPGICLIATGMMLLVADYVDVGMKRANQATYLDAAVVGTAQGVATMPGLSRSGTTIMVGLLCGFEKTFAVKYSFIMSIPAVLGAVVLELKDFTAISVQPAEIVYYVAGMVIAAVVGYICIKTMLVIVRGKRFIGFSIYCFVIGIIAIIWNFVR